MKLDFIKPKYSPHGLFGAASLGTSGCLTIGALSGHDCSPEVIQVSSALIALNALSSIPLLSKNTLRKTLFTQTIRLQCALSYLSIRVFYNDDCLAFFDLLSFMAIFLGLMELWNVSETQKDFDIPLKCAVICSSTFSMYPLQFALLGNSWWLSVQETYPTQALAFAEYVFTPSEFILALIMFAATLVDRKMLSSKNAQVLFIFPVLILIGTVISQEIHMPSTSTQELIIGFPYSNPVVLFNSLKDRLM